MSLTHRISLTTYLSRCCNIYRMWRKVCQFCKYLSIARLFQYLLVINIQEKCTLYIHIMRHKNIVLVLAMETNPAFTFVSRNSSNMDQNFGYDDLMGQG